MNIVVKTADNRYIVRPDTTWERDSEDFYPPEFVTDLSWSPVLFIRISKPGRSVGARFAERYYDQVGYGVLLYPENLIDGSETAYAAASCLDHTSFLQMPAADKASLGQISLDLKAGENAVFHHEGFDPAMIATAIEEATRYIYIRSGDLLAIELQPRKPLEVDGTQVMTGDCTGVPSFKFQIIR